LFIDRGENLYIKNKNIASLFVFIYTLSYFLWILLYNGSAINRTITTDILQIIPPIIVLFILIKAHIKARIRGDHFWLFLTLGCGSYFISQLIWNYYEIVLNIYSPTLAGTAFCWFITFLCYIIAVVNKIKEKRDSKWTNLCIIDTMTFTCVAVALTWIYTIQPSLAFFKGSDFLSKLFYIRYPFINLICLFITTNLFLSIKHDDNERQPLYLVCISFFIMFVANTRFSHLSVLDKFQSGSFTDLLWSLYILVLGLAGFYYLQLSNKNVDETKNNCNKQSQTKVLLILPTFNVIVLFALMLFYRDHIVWMCTSISIMLITLRHALIIFQNKQLIIKLEQLNDSLEDKVIERTQELYEIAFYDQLTGLPNRRLLEDNLKKSVIIAKQNNTNLALLLLDLDRFKTINDSFGHSYGDLMLKEIALRIKNSIDSIYTISRQGGDEFAIIIENYIDKQQIAQIAESIMVEIAKPIKLHSNNIYTTCSIGISLFSSKCSDSETLMRYADAGMYYSKERGKNSYQFYTKELNQSISKKLELETELGKAVNNNEFCLFYQPQINIITGSFTGAEALIRWIHPIYGMISPIDFIPIAEETGMINEIGLWVLETACIEANKMHLEGFKNLKISVNISPKQIQHDNFVLQVTNVIKRTGINPLLLDLEITESASFQYESDIIKKLDELKKLGVKISIDDFGTGYSSLSYLNKLPVDTLKIAQQFVRQIKNDADNKAIISSIIAVAQHLKLNIIAEGVEEMLEFEFLKSQGCFDMQGYMFSKPIPLDELKVIIKKNLLAGEKFEDIV